MITILPEKDKLSIINLFEQSSVEYSDIAGCVIARDREEVLGFCLYTLDDKRMVILHIEPAEDVMLADGILRSALHVAAERSIMDARYSDSAPVELFDKLGFIKDREEKILDIDKLFGGCCCHNQI